MHFMTVQEILYQYTAHSSFCSQEQNTGQANNTS